MNQFVSCVFLFLLISTAAQIRADSRIYGGESATEGEFPFIVSLTRNAEHFCGGFIYNQRFIVTAASCVENLNPSEVTVVVGQYNLILADPYEKRYQVIEIILHGSYNSANNKKNNIALLETSQTITPSIGHVELGYFNVANETVPDSTVMGWGITEQGGLSSIDLRKANVKILPKPNECQNYGTDVYDSIYMVCAGSPTASPCSYDEGSPLFQHGYIVGIVSETEQEFPCTGLFLPTLFTRLSAYSSWLKINAGQQPVIPLVKTLDPMNVKP